MKTIQQNIKLPKVSGKLIKDAGDVFQSHIDYVFVKCGVTEGTTAQHDTFEVKEIEKNMTFSEMFTTEHCMTQEQVIEFCKNNRELLSTYYTFFLIKNDHEFFVALVDVSSDGLDVDADRFENDYVWRAEGRHRVVLPQLETLKLNDTQTLSTLDTLPTTLIINGITYKKENS